MRRALIALLVGGLLLPAPAGAHSYRDPAIRTVLEGVRPPLPPGASVSLVPSVVDQLVVSNTTAALLEVLGRDGRSFLRVSRAGVEGDLAHPDWYATAVPEGAPPLPAFAGPGARPRWVRVSASTSWSEFDPRVRPDVQVTRELRAAGQRRLLTTWSVPLRYGGRPAAAVGQVLLDPVLGGLVVSTDQVPRGLVATPLQGELPGLFLRAPPGREVVVLGRDGRPFLRFADGVVEVNRASPTWREDRRARGELVAGGGWSTLSRGTTASWLDARLRYPRDVPPDDVVRHRAVVLRWSVPLVVDGTRTAVAGTVSWVPRAEALRALRPTREDGGGRVLPWAVAAALVLLVSLLAIGLVRRRPLARRRR